MSITPIHIETDRLLVKTYTANDAKALHQFVKDNVFFLYDSGPMTLRNNTSIARSRKFIEMVERDRIAGKWIWNGIFKKVNQAFIGQTAVYSLDMKDEISELAYFITCEEMGKGFATEAMQATIEYCFKNLNLPKLKLRISPDNVASQRVAEKLGFQKIGKQIASFKTYHGNYIDQDVFELNSNY